MENISSDTIGKRCIYIATAHIMQFALRSEPMRPLFCNKWLQMYAVTQSDK